VLREIINANTQTDIDAVVSHLRGRCADTGMPLALTELLLTQTQQVLSSLIVQGRRIAAVGSQMEATRELTGEGYSIRLVFREGVHRSFFQRLLDRLRGR
jgi:hypothetical protein